LIRILTIGLAHVVRSHVVQVIEIMTLTYQSKIDYEQGVEILSLVV